MQLAAYREHGNSTCSIHVTSRAVQARVNCADSIYPVTRIQEGSVDEMVGIFSVETHGSLIRSLTVQEILEQLEAFPGSLEVCLEEAENIDTDLDMQLDTPRWAKGWGIDDADRMFFFVSGGDVVY